MNLDVQGANLLPSLRSTSFAIGAESGGSTLRNLVQAQIASENIGTRQLSRMFGEDRSDHATFINSGVPSVFFSDGTGGCYHTPLDDPGVVDLGKLREESQVAFRTTVALAEAAAPPAFVSTSPGVNTYQDAQQVQTVLGQALSDLALFAPAQQTNLTSQYAIVQAIVADGPASYDSADQTSVTVAALISFNAVKGLTCNGFCWPTRSRRRRR